MSYTAKAHIGETSRNLKARIFEHKKGYAFGQPFKLASNRQKQNWP